MVTQLSPADSQWVAIQQRDKLALRREQLEVELKEVKQKQKQARKALTEANKRLDQQFKANKQ